MDLPPLSVNALLIGWRRQQLQLICREFSAISKVLRASRLAPYSGLSKTLTVSVVETQQWIAVPDSKSTQSRRALAIVFQASRARLYSRISAGGALKLVFCAYLQQDYVFAQCAVPPPALTRIP